MEKIHVHENVHVFVLNVHVPVYVEISNTSPVEWGGLRLG